MSLFSLKKKALSVALLDISSSSVGGALVYYRKHSLPTLYFSVRVPVELYEGEMLSAGMLRALSVVERMLVEEGGPTLRREVGSGHIDSVLVSVGAPWQDTDITSRSIQKSQAFTFTHAAMESAIQDIEPASEDRLESGRTIIATILNGYETQNPFGKRVNRAEMIVLSSTIEKAIAKEILTSLRKTFHTHDVTLTAFAPAAYSVFRDLYPHQKDFIVLDVSGTATDAAFVKRGLLAGVRTVPHGTHELLEGGKRAAHAHSLPSVGMIDPLRNTAFEARTDELEKTWLLGLREVFTEFSGKQALPRMLFLLADENARGFLKHVLEKSELRSLWLSDEPLSVVPLLPSHIAPYVKTRGLAEGDVYLALLALYCKKGIGNL
ncbi:hypothetical protein KJ819_02155 [Patescibacteria group bacterium]|nr:hypothetical protein [Patescibacteria group bacterium]MBU1500913.1 hypothetical protein [Patescibacteria group bacterium]MBU2080968.1 hypothetical protein [Patescibacteria group bacterium]MBU2124073.1 hypothetical protein [Patescibacteria group bacterium]MBU2194636.1 hypothetical protein [Patescibacteria group bacterium]